MKSLIIPNGFEANYSLGFIRGIQANGGGIVVVSSDEIAARLDALDIDHCNLRGNQDPDRPTWRKAFNLTAYYLRLFRVIFQFRGRPIHFIGLLSSRAIWFEGMFLPLWLRLWAGRYIHTAHNALPHGREGSRWFRWAYRWVYRFPHHIVAHTDKLAGQLETEFKVDPRKITVISIGLNEEVPETDLSAVDCRAKLGLPATGAIALFFGKVEPYKGVDLLAEAWGLVKTRDTRLVVAGWCPDAPYASKVRTAMAASPRADSMEWREGFVPNAEAALLLKACDVVVMPYRNIYQSGVVFLCLRFGMPIVATNVGSLADYIDADSGVFTRTNDPAGIAEALDRFFADPKRFDRGAIAERAKKYSWDRQCVAIKHLYE